ncbi:restriction endonuclease subunit S [Leuconostoc fallax]|uniref:restriction endonuclease subunit S n=1 Tax=Lactobacillaceae TaxID=33958 RepID=UPI002091B6D8|nr:restriction endonuclease subunit S [Leuconostoc fallax]MCO6184587.1 restriction endonuclease subunit S [Leuconostoc fallax]
MSNKVPQIRFKGYSDAWVQREFVKMVDRVSEASTAELPRVEFEDLISGMGRLNKDVTKPGDTRSGIHFVAGDVLYGKLRPYLNNWLHATFEGLALGDFWVFRTKEMLESSFLYALIQAPKYQQAANLSSGTKMPRSDWKTVSTTEFLVPEKQEQQKIGELFNNLDNLIAANQRKLDLLKEQKKGYLQKMFPKNGAKVPELRFAGFADDWEERKLGDEFKKVSERNDGSFGRNHWISVAKMYFQSPEKVQSNNIDTRTYVMREGDIAFEGHPNSEFKFGRFVANDIGAGVVSELFPIYRHQHEYDNNYWKNAIQIERTMAPIFAKSITSSGNSSNKLDTKHFLRQKILIPQINEQKKIGSFFKQLDDTIALHQRKLDLLKEQKKGFLQKMFV